MACQTIDEASVPDLGPIRIDARIRGDIDFSVLDADLPDAGLDAGPDGPFLDAAPDGDPPDARRVPDGSAPPDGDLPDRALPDGAPDIERPDTGVPDMAQPDMALPDAAPVLPCETPWTRAPLVGPCAGRRVTPVSQAVVPSDVEVVATPNGRVVVAFSDQSFIDAGNFELRVLDEESNVVDQAQIVGLELEGELYGAKIALATLRETVHVGLFVTSDLGGRIEHAQLSPENDLSRTELVTGTVGRAGDLDLAVARNGQVHVAWTDRFGLSVSYRARDPGGEWGDVDEIDAHLESDVSGDGAVALGLGAGNLVHVAYQRAQSRFGSIPRIRSLVGGLWNNPRTLDNAANARLSGVGIALALIGETRVVGYVDWVGGTGQLRLAELTAADDEPRFDIRNPAIDLPDSPGDFPLAVGSDDAGRLHLVALRLGEALEYAVRDDDGWTIEIIDDAVPDEPQDLLVDLFVTPDGTAHVAYFDATDGRVHHAVRQP